MGRLEGMLSFLFGTWEVTEEVSGTQEPWKEVAQAIGSPVAWLWASKLFSCPGDLGSATIFKTWPPGSVLGAALLMAPGLLPWNLLWEVNASGEVSKETNVFLTRKVYVADFTLNQSLLLRPM